MRRSFGHALIPALVIPIVVAAVVVPGSAYARGHGAKQVKVACATLGGNYLTGIPTIGGCNQPAATGGLGTFPGSSLGPSGSITVTWTGTGTTTFLYSSTVPDSKGNKCPTGLTEVILHGSVAGNSPIGTGNAGVKGAVHAKICVDLSGGSLRMLTGTFKI